ncbi:MAG TPA: tRNA pseudouridine(55) synthase TruB [Fimbriimonadaceae bacterium]|nr:tRNA pseudouridine(55) synthase TruB [Fimbriimonadaceae bacterium]
MFGILLIDKPPGITSHDVVYRVRRQLGTKKVGHAGTLDPLATGLLVVAVGAATRFLKYLHLEPKEYEFTARFGEETDTYDADGDVVAKKDVPSDLADKVTSVLPKFTGEIAQVPPLYSAVKKEGQPLYKYARQGIDVEREPKSVTVEEFELLSTDGSILSFRAVCSTGTYVRSLIHDIGQEVGCGAHVIRLRRTRVGSFDVADAVSPDECGESDLVSLAEALDPMPSITLNYGQMKLVQNGNFVRADHVPNGAKAALLDELGNVLCVARILENELHPECVVPMEAFDGSV